jgi:hypothetical protein
MLGPQFISNPGCEKELLYFSIGEAISQVAKEAE